MPMAHQVTTSLCFSLQQVSGALTDSYSLSRCLGPDAPWVLGGLGLCTSAAWPSRAPYGRGLPLTRMLLYMLPLSTSRLTLMMQQSPTCWL